MARRDYEGHSVETTITAQVNPTDLSISLAASTGWPTGGANGEFFVTVNPDQVNEERILVASRSGTTLTIANTGKRGQDGTSAGTHASNSVIRHSYSGVDADEANQHVNDTTQDNHTQYLNNARHDISARHLYGAALGTRPTPVATGTSLQAGTAAAPSAGDHVHTVGAGSINSSGMFASGVVDAAAIATNAVGSAEIATDAVGSDEIAALAVTSAELASGAVTSAKIAAGAIDDPGLFSADTKPWFICTAATRPGSPYEGQYIYETDTNRELFWDGAAWVIVSEPIQTYTPTWTAASGGNALGNGILRGRYQRSYNKLSLKILLVFGTTSDGGAGVWTFSLPPTLTALTGYGEQILGCKCFVASSFNFDGFVLIDEGASTLRPHFPAGTSTTIHLQAQNADSGGGAGTGVPLIGGQETWQNTHNFSLYGDIFIN